MVEPLALQLTVAGPLITWSFGARPPMKKSHVARSLEAEHPVSEPLVTELPVAVPMIKKAHAEESLEAENSVVGPPVRGFLKVEPLVGVSLETKLLTEILL